VKANEKKKKPAFNVDTFLATMDGGRSISTYRKNQTVFSQGDSADAVFYIQEGKVKVCVVNELGKEAVVALHNKGDFFGEGCLSGQPLRLATAATMTECAIMRIDKVAMVRYTTSHSLPSGLWRFYWPGMPASRRTWWTSFSIPAKSVWQGHFC
jgi:hypothetical protein